MLGTAALSLALSGCTSPASNDAASSNTSSHAEEGHDHHGQGESQTEVASINPRATLTYDGGLRVINTADGSTVADIKKEGFLRLNPAGDGRHVLVSSTEGFEVLDTGVAAVPHGDHSHYYISEAKLTGSLVAAKKPGHVVTHAGKTALFDDGTGKVNVFETEALEDGKLEDSELTTLTTSAPHHGVAVPLKNGNLLVTEGTEEERHTVREVTPDGTTVTETTDCPGVHGEASAQDSEGGGDVVSFGCTNGSVVYRDGAFHKVPVPESYQRSGNQFGSPKSPVTLTDYKTVKPVEGGEPEHPTQVGLLNTADATTTTLELGSPYWFRSFARGPKGEGLVLTGDGKLHIIDMAAGSVRTTTPVTGEWTEGEKWQDPGVNLKALGNVAYVSDPAAKKLHLIQISSGELISSLELDIVGNEMAVTDGEQPGH